MLDRTHRGPGRPRKSTSTPLMQRSLPEPDRNPGKAPRAQGRNAKPTLSTSTPVLGATPIGKPKRGRGRPPKRSRFNAVTNSTQGTSAAQNHHRHQQRASAILKSISQASNPSASTATSPSPGPSTWHQAVTTPAPTTHFEVIMPPPTTTNVRRSSSVPPQVGSPSSINGAFARSQGSPRRGRSRSMKFTTGTFVFLTVRLYI